MIRVDYRCAHCGVSEHRVSSPPPSDRPCPTCGRPAARRFAAPAVVRARGRLPAAQSPPDEGPAAAHSHSAGCLCGLRPEVLAAARGGDPDRLAATLSPRPAAATT